MSEPKLQHCEMFAFHGKECAEQCASCLEFAAEAAKVRAATPSPEAREPLVIPLTREIDNFTGITITPADAKRIGILGGWRDA